MQRKVILEERRLKYKSVGTRIRTGKSCSQDKLLPFFKHLKVENIDRWRRNRLIHNFTHTIEESIIQKEKERARRIYLAKLRNCVPVIDFDPNTTTN